MDGGNAGRLCGILDIVLSAEIQASLKSGHILVIRDIMSRVDVGSTAYVVHIITTGVGLSTCTRARRAG